VPASCRTCTYAIDATARSSRAGLQRDQAQDHGRRHLQGAEPLRPLPASTPSSRRVDGVEAARSPSHATAATAPPQVYGEVMNTSDDFIKAGSVVDLKA
jgi:hypothetical protein